MVATHLIVLVLLLSTFRAGLSQLEVSSSLLQSFSPAELREMRDVCESQRLSHTEGQSCKEISTVVDLLRFYEPYMDNASKGMLQFAPETLNRVEKSMEDYQDVLSAVSEGNTILSLSNALQGDEMDEEAMEELVASGYSLASLPLSLPLPAPLSNDLVSRLPKSHPLSKTLLTVLTVLEPSLSSLSSCPPSLHQLLLPLSSSFSSSSSFSVLLPSFPLSFSVSPSLSSFLLEPTFAAEGDSSDLEFLSLPLSSPLWLPPSLPHTLSSSSSSEGEGGSGEVMSGIVLRVCFVDAVNADEALYLERLLFSLLSESAEDNSSAESIGISDVRLSQLRPHLLAITGKQPPSLSLQTFLEDLPTDRLFQARGGGESTTTMSSGESVVESGKGGGRKREGRKRGRDSTTFQSWQASQRWKSFLTSLSLPSLPQPPVLETVGRTFCDVSWLADFDLSSEKEGDLTSGGFLLSWQSQDDNDEEETVSFLAVPESKLSDKQGGQESLVAYEKSLHLEETRRKGVDVFLYSARLTPLPASTPFKVRVALVYGEAQGKPSPWSKRETTLSLSVPQPTFDPPSLRLNPSSASSSSHPFSLLVHCPYDDGGMPVLGYEVQMLQEHPHFPSTWLSLGLVEPLSSLDLKGKAALPLPPLLPTVPVRFRVKAVNELGASTAFSLPSVTQVPQTVLGADRKAVGELQGKGHPSRKKAHLQFDTLGKGFDQGEVDDGLLVTVSPSKQTVSSAAHPALPAWGCHWGLVDMDVTAHAVWMNPPDLDGPIKNGHELRHKIVLILRSGTMPLVNKVLSAQKQGALGVILVDQGRCTAYDQRCLPGADKSRGERFGVLDRPALWSKVHVPVVFLLKEEAQKLEHDVHLRMPAIFRQREEL